MTGCLEEDRPQRGRPSRESRGPPASTRNWLAKVSRVAFLPSRNACGHRPAAGLYESGQHLFSMEQTDRPSPGRISGEKIRGKRTFCFPRAAAAYCLKYTRNVEPAPS
jgi:hypothetical protein